MTGTIYDMITQAVRTPPAKVRSTYSLYPLTGLDDYELRVDRDVNPLLAIGEHSSLYPVTFHVERNFGQAVLDSHEGYQIVLKKDGETLDEMLRRRRLYHLRTRPQENDKSIDSQENDKSINLRAQKDVLSFLDSLETSEFNSLTEDIRHLWEHKKWLNLDWEHILASSEGVSLTGLKNNKPDYGENLTNIKKSWWPHDIWPENTDNDFHCLHDNVERKIQEAARQASIPASLKLAKASLKQRTFSFRPASEIEGITELPLSGLPQELQEKLREIESRLKIPLGRA